MSPITTAIQNPELTLSDVSVVSPENNGYTADRSRKGRDQFLSHRHPAYASFETRTFFASERPRAGVRISGRTGVRISGQGGRRRGVRISAHDASASSRAGVRISGRAGVRISSRTGVRINNHAGVRISSHTGVRISGRENAPLIGHSGVRISTAARTSHPPRIPRFRHGVRISAHEASASSRAGVRISSHTGVRISNLAGVRISSRTGVRISNHAGVRISSRTGGAQRRAFAARTDALPRAA